MSVFSAFCASHHVLTGLSGFRENGGLLHLQQLKAKSEITEYLRSQRKSVKIVSSAYGVAFEKERGGETRKGEEEADGGKAVRVNDAL